VVYERPDQKGLPDRRYDLKFEAQFPDWLSIVFGTQAPTTNQDISQRLGSITASWFGDQYGRSWQANLAAHEWPLEEGGEICAEILPDSDTSWNGICGIPGFPEWALPVQLEIAASKDEEAEIMIEYAWKAGLAFRGTLALMMVWYWERMKHLSLVSPTIFRDWKLGLHWIQYGTLGE
jgi:hypothetical protein